MIHFTLKRKGWGYEDVYEALKSGEKNIEWRDASPFWESRLLTSSGRELVNQSRNKPMLLLIPKTCCKDDMAKFVVGYTKYPRLIMKIINIVYNPVSNQFAIYVEPIREETEDRIVKYYRPKTL